MQATLHSTTKIVTLMIGDANLPARVWEGETAAGVPFHAFIVRVGVREGMDATEFDRDLKEHAAPTPAIQAIPLRMII